MLRIVVCSAALIAMIVAVRWALGNAIDSWGLGWGTVLCATILGITFFIAHRIDRADSRSQAPRPPRRPGYR